MTTSQKWNRITEDDLLAALAGKESGGCTPTNVYPSIMDEYKSGREFYSPVIIGVAEQTLDLYTARRLARAGSK